MPARLNLITLALLCFLASACRQTPATRTYPMHGQIVALNQQDRTATIKHGDIGTWMKAMTMEYPIKSDADFKKLAVGEQIDATVFLSDSTYSVGDVKVAAAR